MQSAVGWFMPRCGVMPFCYSQRVAFPWSKPSHFTQNTPPRRMKSVMARLCQSSFVLLTATNEYVLA